MELPLTIALIEYCLDNPAVCEIQCSISKSGQGIESVNIWIKDKDDKPLQPMIWREFRQGEKTAREIPGWPNV